MIFVWGKWSNIEMESLQDKRRRRVCVLCVYRRCDDTYAQVCLSSARISGAEIVSPILRRCNYVQGESAARPRAAEVLITSRVSGGLFISVKCQFNYKFWAFLRSRLNAWFFAGTEKSLATWQMRQADARANRTSIPLQIDGTIALCHRN